MAESTENFADLFSRALERIKDTGTTKETVKKEIADAIGVVTRTIEFWLQGKYRPLHPQAEITAKILFNRRGLLDRGEFELFLTSAGHPSPPSVWRTLFAKVDGPPDDDFDIFVGRKKKIEELARALQPMRVVLFWGPGGVGKTSLVRKVIQTLAPNNTSPQQFPDGILYYEYSEQEHKADDVFWYILRFFEVEVTQEMSLRDAAGWALKDKKALIVLDGAEQADDLRTIRRILHQCGLLVVSRYEYANLASKTIYLDILSIDEAIMALRSWSTDVENQTDFQVWNDGNEDDPIAHEICEELGRLPLALRLAARYMLHRRVNPAKFIGLWREWRLSLLHEGKHQHDSLQVLMKESLKQVEQESKDACEVMATAGLLSYKPFTTEVIAAALEKSLERVMHLTRRSGQRS